MGSSGGGGGSSGEVDFPDYMKQIHEDWLRGVGTTLGTENVTAIMAAAIGSSPYIGATAYNPNNDIAAYDAVISSFASLLSGISDTDDWSKMYSQAAASIGSPVTISDSTIAEDVSAFADQLDDEITSKILPRFRRGMQDINAVVSSSFVIGESNIEAFRNRDVSRHASTLRVNAAIKNADIDTANRKLFLEGSGQMLNLMLSRIGFNESLAKLSVEANRIKIVANKEYVDRNIEIDKEDALWDLSVFQYGANVMASISGGTSVTKTSGPSTAQSAIGGGLSGAAAGAMVGSTVGAPVPGAIIGGVLGAAAGLL